jgi:hypothetical protein
VSRELTPQQFITLAIQVLPRSFTREAQVLFDESIRRDCQNKLGLQLKRLQAAFLIYFQEDIPVFYEIIQDMLKKREVVLLCLIYQGNNLECKQVLSFPHTVSGEMNLFFYLPDKLPANLEERLKKESPYPACGGINKSSRAV